MKILFSCCVTRTVYFCKLELAEIYGSGRKAGKAKCRVHTVCLCTCACVSDGTPGPGLRLYTCKLPRWCAGALDQGPEKHTTPKEYVSRGLMFYRRSPAAGPPPTTDFRWFLAGVSTIRDPGNIPLCAIPLCVCRRIIRVKAGTKALPGSPGVGLGKGAAGRGPAPSVR